MFKRSFLVAAAVCLVAALMSGMSACVFDSDNNVILAKHHFTVEKYDLPEGVASLDVTSDYETDSKGSYVTDGKYIRFEMYLLQGYELGTLGSATTCTGRGLWSSPPMKATSRACPSTARHSTSTTISLPPSEARPLKRQNDIMRPICKKRTLMCAFCHNKCHFVNNMSPDLAECVFPVPDGARASAAESAVIYCRPSPVSAGGSFQTSIPHRTISG